MKNITKDEFYSNSNNKKINNKNSEVFLEKYIDKIGNSCKLFNKNEVLYDIDTK
jgi:hypothetical protein